MRYCTKSRFAEVKTTSPTIDQLLRFYKRMPVLIYERVKTAQYLRVFKRYKNELVFIGNMNVLGILLIGLTGYWYLVGTKFASHIYEGLVALMATAKLDDEMYQITEWSQKKGRLVVYVTRKFASKRSQRTSFNV